MAEYKPTDLELEAINVVRQEREAWSEAVAFVTEKVAFQMRNLIRQLRKNYYGVFDVPTDKVTGRKKTWIPLTETVVESVVKNIDLDTKDVNVYAKHPSAVGFTPTARAIIRNNLEDAGFGEKLDELERNLAIDGTAVWKTLEKKGKDGRVFADIRVVDLLNVYIDPTARSIQEAYRFTERAVLTLDEVKSMKGWMNTEFAIATTGISLSGDRIGESGSVTGTSKYVDVWELWGKLPGKFFNQEDEVEGRVVVSGLENNKPVVHLLEKNLKGWRPYEEAWYARVPGRWYGRGVAEKLLMLQSWMNTIKNIAINRSYVSQLGLFKARKGSGLSAQMFSRLASNGVLFVNNMDDIEQFIVQEASPAAMNEEAGIFSWAQRVTSAFETVTGERLPSETTATAIAVQSRAGQSQFVLVKEGIGMFLQRWLRRHALPIIVKNTRVGDLVRISGSADELTQWDERLVNHLLAKRIDEAKASGERINADDVERAKERAIEQLRAQGRERIVEQDMSLDFTRFDIRIEVTNERIDPAIVAQNLVTVLQAAPQYAPVILPQLIDFMGLDANQVQQINEQIPALPQGQAPQGDTVTNPAQLLERAATQQR